MGFSDDKPDTPDTAVNFTTVLVVEDYDMGRQSLCELLDFSGYQVLGVATGEEAIAAFRRYTIDIVLLDLTLPGMSGAETLQTLRSIKADVNVILVSGAPPPYAETLSAGADTADFGNTPFVAKPIRITPLMQLMDDILEKGGHISGGARCCDR